MLSVNHRIGNLLLAFAGGILLSAAWPTYGYALLIFIAFVPLLVMEENIRLQEGKHKGFRLFVTAYLAFFIWNVFTTWWIWNSTPAGAVFALTVNSLLMSLVFLLYHGVSRRKPRRFSLIFLVAVWLAFEKFHLEWQFSWPWLNLGNVFSENPHWVQWYEYTGIAGGTLWILLVNILIFSAIRHFKDKKTIIKRLIAAAAVVVAGIYFSLYKYYTFPGGGENFQAVVLQPATDPYTEKYHRPMHEIAAELTALATPQMNDSVRFVLAPETVLSRMTTKDAFVHSAAYGTLSAFVEKYPQAAIITGIDLYRVIDSKEMPTPTANPFPNAKDKWYESYNAAMLIAAGKQPETYYKSKLVVGVEHFPYRSLLMPLFGNILIAHGSSPNVLTPQGYPVVFEHRGIRAAPVICYESIYGEHLGGFVRDGAGFLAIITNDSWWGDTEGHRQLNSYARLRAVEMRRDIARSANSGISSFINARGDVMKTLPYGAKGALRGSLYLRHGLTVYARFGDYIYRIASFVAVLFLLIGLFVRAKRQ